MYSCLGYDSDVCLFYVKGEFFAMDARCSHSGKSSHLVFYLGIITYNIAHSATWKLYSRKNEACDYRTAIVRLPDWSLPYINSL